MVWFRDSGSTEKQDVIAAEIFDGLTIPAIGFKQSLQSHSIALYQAEAFLSFDHDLIDLIESGSHFSGLCSKLWQSGDDHGRTNDIHAPRGHRPGRTITGRMR